MKKKRKKDKIIIVKVSPEFTKFYCLSDWPCVCRSAVRAFLLAGRMSLKSFSQSMCQTGMQRINLQPETKIWKCPGGPGGMFLTPDSFRGGSDAACPGFSPEQPQFAKAESVLRAGALSTAQPPHKHFCAELGRIPAGWGELRSAPFQGQPGCCACFHEELALFSWSSFIIGLQLSEKAGIELRSCI